METPRTSSADACVVATALCNLQGGSLPLARNCSGRVVRVRRVAAHLAEMLNARPDYLVHIYTEITKLDESGYIHQPRMHGLKFAEMKYEFKAVRHGTRYTNSLTVGFRGILGRLVNPLIRPFVFDEARGKAWIKHNVEEVGNFELFLPKLFKLENFKRVKGTNAVRRTPLKLAPAI